MEIYAKKLTELLKTSGYSITAPRKVVFEVLYSFGLQSMSQLVERCKTIDRASVYRSVDVLEKVGAIVRVPQGLRYNLELSDTFLPHHHHILCIKCGQQTEIEQSALEKLLTSIAADLNYSLTAHKLELQGICTKCHATTTKP